MLQLLHGRGLLQMIFPDWYLWRKYTATENHGLFWQNIKNVVEARYVSHENFILVLNQGGDPSDVCLPLPGEVGGEGDGEDDGEDGWVCDGGDGGDDGDGEGDGEI